MISRIRHILLLLIGVVAFMACNPTRRLAEDEYLLEANEIEVEGDRIDTDEVESIIKQKSNRRIANLVRFHLAVYNSTNPIKTQRRIVQKQIKLGKRNMRRMSQGKDSVEYSTTYQEWKMYTVGEAPVIFDSALMYKSKEQIGLYMQKIGYFSNQVEVVTDTLGAGRKKGDKQRIKVTYKIKTGPRHILSKITIQCSDDKLKQMIAKAISPKGVPEFEPTDLRLNEPFNIYELDSERDRLVKFLKDNAYWKFSKEYLKFNADTFQKANEVHLTLSVKDLKVVHPDYPDSTISAPHQQYKIGDITYIVDYYPSEERDVRRDTFFHNGPTGKEHYFLFRYQLDVNPDLLIQSTFLRPRGWWKQKYVERTYKRLSELGVYRNVTVELQDSKDPSGPNPEVDVVFILTPYKRKSFAVETNGTHKAGFLGISGSFNFRDKNPFGGAENLRIGLVGGIEAQQTLTSNASDNENDNPVGLSSFNTVEFGPEIALKIPRFLLPISLESLSRSSMPFTVAKATLNFQRRPDYTRRLGQVSLGYEFQEVKTVKWEVHPFELSVVRINKSAAFQARIDSLNDALLANSYQDHLILGPTIHRTYDSQKSVRIKNRKNRYYHTARLELAAPLMNVWTDLAGAPLDENGAHTLLGVRYAQFVLIDSDLRYYRTFNSKHSFAARLATGAGITGSNLPALPFEKSFFSGGANGLRGWRSRTLGPGSFFDPEQSFDKIGDIRLEAQAEYRFDLISFVEAAFFVDAGNIWLRKPDDLRPGGDFELRDFHREIAVSAGAGARLDFSFFIVRVDVGVPIKNPSLPEGERWIWQDHPIYETWTDNINRYAPNLNIGIGYPF